MSPIWAVRASTPVRRGVLGLVQRHYVKGEDVR